MIEVRLLYATVDCGDFSRHRDARSEHSRSLELIPHSVRIHDSTGVDGHIARGRLNLSDNHWNRSSPFACHTTSTAAATGT
jgi:hypothetical protein